jgi:hypothetical protein
VLRERTLPVMDTRTRSLARRTAVAACCALLLTACGTDAGDGMTDGSGPAPTPPAGAAEASLVSLDALSDEVAAAIADASERFGVPPSEVAVAGALRVVWSDGALGCPAPGMMYTQALVDGYQLTLEVDGRRVAYHGEDGRPPFLCER